MSEFTKEELEDLLLWGNTYCIDMPMIATMHHSNLIGKIESMIDNYCDHKNQYTDSNYFTGCADCGRKW